MELRIPEGIQTGDSHLESLSKGIHSLRVMPELPGFPSAVLELGNSSGLELRIPEGFPSSTLEIPFWNPFPRKFRPWE